MAYKANIPQAADYQNNSQPDLLNNFIAINTFVGVDHVTFNTADEGKHNRVFFKQQVPNQVAPLPVTDANGDPATGATEAAIYTKNSVATPGSPGLFYRPSSSAAVVELSASFSATKAATGSAMLPSGVILKWGPVNATTAGTPAGFATAFPTACMSVQLTAKSTGAANNFVSVDGMNAASFTAYSTTRTGGASAIDCYYLAIGY